MRQSHLKQWLASAEVKGGGEVRSCVAEAEERESQRS